MAETDTVARVFVLGGPDVGRSFEIRSRAVLGRANDCDVRLHDRSISRHHARIEHEGSGWFVVDQGSTNGVSKNGKRVARAELADCDEFLLGELPLRFRFGPSEGDSLELAAGTASPRSAAPAREAAREPAAREPVVPAVGLDPEETELEEIVLGEEPTNPAPAAPPARLQRAARAVEARGSILSGDLAQRPLWLRMLLALIVLALSAGLFLAAFEAVKLLRGSV